jgi:hypothetical protein
LEGQTQLKGKRKEGKEGEGINNVLDECPIIMHFDADLLVLDWNVADTTLRGLNAQ